MSKYNSLVEMAENEFNENKYLLLYFIDVFKIINQILSNNENNKDDENKINEIFIGVNNIIKEYKIKIEKEKNNKLFPFLYKGFQKIMNLLFNEENTNNIIDNSIYGQFLLNNNNSMNITYLNNNINNTILNDTNLNNMNSKLNNSISNSNIIINLKNKNNVNRMWIKMTFIFSKCM